MSYSSNNNEVATVSEDGSIKGIKEGTAIIYVTTEDQLKTASCIVNVRKKNPSISFDKTIYNVIKEKATSFEVVINDSEILDYDIKIEDESIAKVQDGKIVGVSSGTTQITANIRGTDIKKQATINVIELKEGDIVFDQNLIVDGDIISRVQPETTVGDIKEKIHTDYTVYVSNINDEVLEEDKLIGTGSKIKLLNAENEKVYEYNILIYGDVNSDGKINSGDLLSIVKHLNKSNVYSNEIVLRAADVNNDSKINSGDLLRIVKYLNSSVALGN